MCCLYFFSASASPSHYLFPSTTRFRIPDPELHRQTRTFYCKRNLTKHNTRARISKAFRSKKLPSSSTMSNVPNWHDLLENANLTSARANSLIWGSEHSFMDDDDRSTTTSRQISVVSFPPSRLSSVSVPGSAGRPSLLHAPSARGEILFLPRLFLQRHGLPQNGQHHACSHSPTTQR